MADESRGATVKNYVPDLIDRRVVIEALEAERQRVFDGVSPFTVNAHQELLLEGWLDSLSKAVDIVRSVSSKSALECATNHGKTLVTLGYAVRMYHGYYTFCPDCGVRLGEN